MDHETAADCPWAQIARDAAAGSAPAVLAGEAKAILDQLARDHQLLGAWGRAVNFNQAPDGTFGDQPIVAPAIADVLHERAGVARDGRIVHAGVQHTYGYLFSLLATPYGWKRARWVQPAIEQGFGLPAGTIAPVPTAGTLLANATWIAASIAFAGNEPALVRARVPQLVAPAVRDYDFGALHVKRLRETVVVDHRVVELHTDFVDFPHPTADAAALLVYSVLDGGPPQLITMFPIGAASRDKYEAAPLGDDVPISAQYNAYVEGLTGKPPIAGRRALD